MTDQCNHTETHSVQAGLAYCLCDTTRSEKTLGWSNTPSTSALRRGFDHTRGVLIVVVSSNRTRVFGHDRDITVLSHSPNLRACITQLLNGAHKSQMYLGEKAGYTNLHWAHLQANFVREDEHQDHNVQMNKDLTLGCHNTPIYSTSIAVSTRN